MESEIAVVATLASFLDFIKIENLPSLVQSVVSSPDNDVLAFTVFITRHIKYSLIFDVDKVLSNVSEELEPM